MKKRCLFNRMLLPGLILSLLLFNTCKDDKENPDTSYRVIQMNYLIDNDLDAKSLFTYDGEKITLISTFDYGDGDSAKTEVNYPDNNSAVMIDYNYLNGNWQESFKQEMEFQNEDATQIVCFVNIDGIWELFSKSTFQYTGSNLTEEISYEYIDGNWIPSRKSIYEYNESKLILSEEYIYQEDWDLYTKTEFSYNGDKMDDEIVSSYFAGSFTQESKFEYNYQGGLLMNIDCYDYDNGVWVFLGVFMSFTYDSYGNLATWDEPLLGITNAEFLYEEGKGNIRQIYYSNMGILGFMTPLPTKSKRNHLYYNRPAIKYLLHYFDF